jgi:hypothetical protein
VAICWVGECCNTGNEWALEKEKAPAGLFVEYSDSGAAKRRVFFIVFPFRWKTPLKGELVYLGEANSGTGNI